MSRVTIVGAGIVGSIAARWLRRKGVPVTVIDQSANRAMGASRASGGCMTPNWVSGLPKQDVREALDLYAELGLLREVPVRAFGAKLATLAVVPPQSALVPPDEVRVVLDVRDLDATQAVYRALGAWGPKVVKQKWGISFTSDAPVADHVTLKVWAPYRQSLAVPHGDHMWYGDGTALKPTSVTLETVGKSQVRLSKQFDVPPRLRMWEEGVRGLTDDKYGVFEKLPGTNVWDAYGAGKNGWMLAAVWARRFARAVGAE